MKCPACSGDHPFKNKFETRSILFNESFTIGVCPSCGLERVLNIPEDLGRYYAGTSMKKRLNKIHSSMKKILLKKELGRLLKSSDKNSTFLDIGCGVGDFTNLISEQGREVIAIDATPERPFNITSKTKIPYHTINYDNYTIDHFSPLKNGTVILRHVLEHTIDPAEFIQKLISYGVKGFYIVVPNHDCLEARLWGQYYYFLDPPLHLTFFTHQTVKLLLNKCQLNIVESGYDTIPNLVSSVYRYLSLKGCSKNICNLLRPQSVINSLSAPLNIFFPRNVLWVYAKLN